MAQMQTVTVPGTNLRAQVPATYSDAQVRKALALQYKKATGFGVEQAPVVNPKTPLNRPIPQSNEAYWKQRLAGQGNLHASPDTIRSRISQGAASLAGLATNPRHAAQIGEKVAGAVDWVPGLGDAMGLQEAWGDLKRGVNTGDYATAGLAGLAGAATLLPGALDKPVKRGMGQLFKDESGAIRAWHGSPHDFDRFSLDKIGTGEGAQAYGHGLYFAENKAVAEDYRKALSRSVGSPESMAAAALEGHGSREAALKFYEDNIAAELAKPNPDKGWVAQYQPALDLLRSQQPLTAKPGRLYEVNIDAEPEDFLDWDAPLSGQPKSLRRVDGGELFKESLSPYENTSGNGLYRALSSDLGGPAAASQALKEAGVPGLRFFDQGSRGTGQGSRNLVTFDDRLVNILRKY